MAGINRVILIGHVGAAPELRQAGDRQVSTWSLATDEAWTDQTGQRQERTEWHRVVCWARLAEIATSYLRQGSRVYVEGRLQTRSWDKDGVKRYTTEVVATLLELLDPRPVGDGRERPDARPVPAATEVAADTAGQGQDDLPF